MADERVSITASSTYAANTAAIIGQAIFHPNSTLVILPADKTKSPDPENEPDAIVSSPHFLTILRYFFGLMLLLTVAWALIGFFVVTDTDNKKEVFWLFGHLVSLGWGGFIGLATGKQFA
jgi:hypothetical protein